MTKNYFKKDKDTNHYNPSVIVLKDSKPRNIDFEIWHARARKDDDDYELRIGSLKRIKASLGSNSTLDYDIIQKCFEQLPAEIEDDFMESLSLEELVKFHKIKLEHLKKHGPNLEIAQAERELNYYITMYEYAEPIERKEKERSRMIALAWMDYILENCPHLNPFERSYFVFQQNPPKLKRVHC